LFFEVIVIKRARIKWKWLTSKTKSLGGSSCWASFFNLKFALELHNTQKLPSCEYSLLSKALAALALSLFPPCPPQSCGSKLLSLHWLFCYLSLLCNHDDTVNRTGMCIEHMGLNFGVEIFHLHIFHLNFTKKKSQTPVLS
jgi:hypothetical protein